MERQKIAKTKQTADQGKTPSSAHPVLPAMATAEHILYLQRTIGNQSVLRLLQTKLKSGQLGDQYEQEADHVAEQVAHSSEASGPRLSSTGLTIQRQEKESTARIETPSPGLIVEDEAEDVRPGQMRKSEFLSELKTSVCSAAEEALSGTIWSAMGCPYIERWFEHYNQQDSQHVERALRKYAPETASVRTAREYIPIITQRVRRGIKQWTETGEVTGVPEELARGGMPGVTAGGLIGGLVSGALSAVGSAVSGLVSGVGRAVSGIGRALFKGREGGAREGEDPEAIQSQLGSGYTLDGGVKSRMELAFGISFSNVRIHTDSKASELSDRLNARAFTIGSDIAFGSGEYQPGTPVGDALVAHELAHVVQQGGGKAANGPLPKGEAESSALEQEADVSAVGAVVSVWGGIRGTLQDIGKNAMPRLRSGLRLQRCGHTPEKPSTKYGEYILEGIEKLRDFGFGLPWNSKDCSTRKVHDYRTNQWIDGFDTDYWEKPPKECRLVPKKNVTPATAIKQLFNPDRKNRWAVDCGEFTQLPHFYAMLRTLVDQAGGNEKQGEDLFNQRFSAIELKRLESKGLKTRALWGRFGPNEPMQEFELAQPGPGAVMKQTKFGPEPVPKKDGAKKSLDQVLKDAPVGSRVEFTNNNLLKEGKEAYAFENTIKAGDGLYAAHGLSTGFLTQEEIIDELAEFAEYPGQAKPKIYISEVEYFDLP